MKDRLIKASMDGRKGRSILAVILVVFTLVVTAWAFVLGQDVPREPLQADEFSRGLVSSHHLGLAFEAILVPILCILYLGNLPLFMRFVLGEAVDQDRRRLFIVLCLCWLAMALYDSWRFYRTFDVFLFGFLIVVVGGWLGGWRWGLGLGLPALFISGGIVAILDARGASLLACLQGSEFGHLGCGFLFQFLFSNLKTAMILWVGIAAGLFSDLLKERRFNLVTMTLSGAGLKLVALLPILLVVERPNEFSRFIVPETLAAALAMCLLALIIRDIQASETQRRANRMELSLAQAELRALRAQINPHFFFNALNTIRYFIRTQPDTARALLLDLSEIFQRTLRAGDFVSLRDELDYVRSYLALELARLGDRLTIQWSTMDDAFLEYPVPTLILQPVVENAILHGVAEKEQGGTLSISVERLPQELSLNVRDDGPGMDQDCLERAFCQKEDNHCIGLRNVDGRLRAIYGSQRLWIHTTPGAGCHVEIRIPISEDAMSKSEESNADSDRRR